MRHPVTSETRLVGTGTRLFRRFFKRQDPHGWADYHCVEEPDGTFWIHCHGLRRWRLRDVEFVGVPREMCGYAHQLMFEIIAEGRAGQGLVPDHDIEGVFSAPRQNFRQAATLRTALRDDPEHRDMVRIVDRDQPLESGFPRRLFASHIAAWAEFAEDPAQKEAMCRRALAIFPGFFLEMNAGAEIRPRDPDLTDLQLRANLSVYVSLAQALFDQGRAEEGFGYLEQAIARCPGWAGIYREYMSKTVRRKDPYADFWRQADIAEICARLRPANTTGPLARPKKTTTARPRKTRRVKKSA